MVSLAATALSVLFGVPLAWVLARGRSRAARSCARSWSCRSCSRRSWAASACSSRSDASGVVGGGSTTRSGSSSRSPPGARSSRRRSCRCRSSCSPPRRVSARSTTLRGRGRHARRPPGYALRRVVLPMLAPQLAAGAVLAWARALGEFGATITFAGNLAGRTQTLPLAVYEARQTDPGGAIFLSLMLVVHLGRRARRDARPDHGRRADARLDADRRRRAAATSRSRPRSRSATARRSRCSARTAPASPRSLEALAGLAAARPRDDRARRRAHRRPAAGAPARRRRASRTTCSSPRCRRWRTSRSRCARAGVRRAGPRARRTELLARLAPAVDAGREARRALRAASGSAWRSRARSRRARAAPARRAARRVDVSARAELRALSGEVARAFDGACVLVAHDPIDALTLADRVAILEDGRDHADGHARGDPARARERLRGRPRRREPVRRARSSPLDAGAGRSRPTDGTSSRSPGRARSPRRRRRRRRDPATRRRLAAPRAARGLGAQRRSAGAIAEVAVHGERARVRSRPRRRSWPRSPRGSVDAPGPRAGRRGLRVLQGGRGPLSSGSKASRTRYPGP